MGSTTRLVCLYIQLCIRYCRRCISLQRRQVKSLKLIFERGFVRALQMLRRSAKVIVYE